MSYILLQHDKRLNDSESKELPELASHMVNKTEDHALITFRATKKIAPHTIYKNINACTRYLNLPKGDLIFYYVESDSPLSSLILWDAAHTLPIDKTITIIDDIPCSLSYLAREYFSDAMKIEKQDKHKLVFRKIKPLAIEQDSGLDRWSFCIPTGPGDSTGLNVIVKRILELNIPEKEILLCGRPDQEFLYWDHVRIIGEDIPAPPVWITRKKNQLAKEAKYENLCILHDRVFLPLNFLKAIHRFGDYFPFATFQSIWFDNLLNISPGRYSDLGTFKSARSDISTLFSPLLFTELEELGFRYGNALRNDVNNFLTGSLYIVKRHLWLNTPQNEQLFWAEFEDIEQAYRCTQKGIPHRIIPGEFTQSLFARPVLTYSNSQTYLTANGTIKNPHNTFPLPAKYLKPLIKLSENEAKKRLYIFIEKYCLHLYRYISNENNFLRKLILTIRGAELPFFRKNVIQFIDDVEKNIICDQLGFNHRKFLFEQFVQHKSTGKINLTVHCIPLLLQLALRPGKKRFYHSLLEYFPKRCWQIKLGSLISALRLYLNNGDYFYHPDGFKGFYKSILESTPFIDYTEKKS
jgi:hypothetical protein